MAILWSCTLFNIKHDSIKQIVCVILREKFKFNKETNHASHGCNDISTQEHEKKEYLPL